MKIALLTTAFYPKINEALSITIKQLGRQLTILNHQVTIVSGRTNYRNVTKEIFEGIEIWRPYKVHGFPNNKLNIISVLKACFSHITVQPAGLKLLIKKKHKNFDVIHGFSSSPLLVLRTILAKTHSKSSITIHTIKGKSIFQFTDWFSFLLNFVDKVTVANNERKIRLVKFGCNSRKIKIIPSNIDIEKFTPLNKKILKKKYQYKCSLLLYYGHLTELKGISYLIKSMKLVSEDVPKIKLLIIPSTSEKKYCSPYEKLIKQEKLNKYVKIIKNKVKIEEYVSLADIVVLPYPHLISTEGNPSCLLESMACKTPVVTTDLPELREIVTPDVDVLMAKPKNSEELAKKILKLLCDKKLQKRLSKSAFEKSKKFDVKKITEQYLKIYKELLKKSKNS